MSATEFFIETPRLILREHRLDDVQRIYEISCQPGFVYYRLDGTREAAEMLVRDAIKKQEGDMETGRRDHFLVAVVLKDTSASGTVIGQALIQRADHLPEVKYEPGYFIDPIHQGKGYGPEALCNMIDFAFNELQQDRLTSTQHPDNHKAISLAERYYGYRTIGEIEIDTVHGPEPRLLSVTTSADFYRLRNDDHDQMFLSPRR